MREERHGNHQTATAPRLTTGALGRIGRRPRVALFLAGLLAFALHAALSFIWFPEPKVVDEFSYLLAADTFASGRVTNPTHPLWPHFETNHVIQRPTYQSAYPPGEGLLLAAGQVLGGHPAVGLWLGAALASWAAGWMLLAWVPPLWALAGALVAAVHPGVAVYWHQSYMGGTVAMIGGALLFGGLRRLFARPSAWTSMLLGLGLAILANSRPYEGLVASLPAAAALAAWIRRQKREGAPRSRVLLALAITLTAAAAWTAYYNGRVTGNPLRLPYQVHEAAYAAAPNFFWQRPRPVVAPHGSMRAYQKARLQTYEEQQSARGLAAGSMRKIAVLLRFYLATGLLLPPLLALRSALRDRWMLLAALSCGVTVLAILALKSVTPHYVSPVASLGLALWLEACRRFLRWRPRGLPVGAVALSAMAALLVASPALLLARLASRHAESWHLRRAAIVAELEKLPGKHLILVRYTESQPRPEWVYNRADIDGAKTAWARELDPASNDAVLRHFSGHRVWLLEAEGQKGRLAPHAAAGRPNRER